MSRRTVQKTRVNHYFLRVREVTPMSLPLILALIKTDFVTQRRIVHCFHAHPVSIRNNNTVLNVKYRGECGLDIVITSNEWTEYIVIFNKYLMSTRNRWIGGSLVYRVGGYANIIIVSVIVTRATDDFNLYYNFVVITMYSLKSNTRNACKAYAKFVHRSERGVNSKTLCMWCSENHRCGWDCGKNIFSIWQNYRIWKINFVKRIHSVKNTKISKINIW